MKRKPRVLTPAMAFILLFSIVSLLSDMTHEGAASIRGAFLSLLGASAATIGFVSGLGELFGYSLRFVFGRLTDRTRQYWPITIIGYTIDVLAVPALALCGEHGWLLASAFIVLERVGKAMKKPAKNTLLSFAALQEGVGKSFAILEALDQIGAFLGPVILFLVLLFKKDGNQLDAYRLCFLVLGIPALITIGLLFFAKKKFPHPEDFEKAEDEKTPFRANMGFWVYIAGICCLAFGFIDFPLITLHVARTALISMDALPLLYAGAMVVDAFAALWFGFLYDKRGMLALVVSTALSAGSAALIFGVSGLWATGLGVMLWGVGMGAQESILKSVVKSIVPKANRAAGYGVFETAFGAAWFLGSMVTGVLYDASRPLMIMVSVAMQLAAIPLFYKVSRADRG